MKVVFLILFFLVSCATLPPEGRFSQNEEILPRFEDIPIPGGFILDHKNSFLYQSGGLRVGIVNYKGQGDIDKLLRFYKETMPDNGWRMLNLEEYGIKRLNFIKNNELCAITIENKGRRIEIIIRVSPLDSEFKNTLLE